MVQPSDQISAGAPYPRGPLSMISGAMYCKVPSQDKKNCQVLQSSFLLEKINTPLSKPKIVRCNLYNQNIWFPISPLKTRQKLMF